MSMFQPAVRSRAHLKMSVIGPSGSGKTLSALYLARGIAGPDGKIALIDTENESASLYADKVEFDTCPIAAPFTTEKYIEAIQAATKAEYAVLVIDSLTHAWAGEGGLLAQKESLDARGGNSFTNWASITKKHENLKAALLQSPIHVICTMRSKQDYVIDQSGGKSAPKKVGMAPIQREGKEYEFTVVLDVAANHEAAASKDRTGLFDGRYEVVTVKHGERLREWLESGAEVKPAPDPALREARKDFFRTALAAGLSVGTKEAPDGEKMKSLAREVLCFVSGNLLGEWDLSVAENWRDATLALGDYKVSIHGSPAPEGDTVPEMRPAEGTPANQCTTPGCRNILTPSQMVTSREKFGKPVCLVCQRTAGADTDLPKEDFEDPFKD